MHGCVAELKRSDEVLRSILKQVSSLYIHTAPSGPIHGAEQLDRKCIGLCALRSNLQQYGYRLRTLAFSIPQGTRPATGEAGPGFCPFGCVFHGAIATLLPVYHVYPTKPRNSAGPRGWERRCCAGDLGRDWFSEVDGPRW